MMAAGKLARRPGWYTAGDGRDTVAARADEAQADRGGTMNLEQLKEKARTAGYTKIRGDAEGAPLINLAQWRGVATGESRGTHQGLPAVVTRQVAYHLEGNRVRAKRAGDREFWYILT
jgi:hypothetical protein